MSNQFDDVPQEVIEAYHAQQKVHKIENDEFAHGIVDFVTGLTRPQLEALSSLVLAIAMSGVGQYWLGFIASRLDTEYDICPMCKVAHAPLEHSEPYVQEETLFDVNP